METTVNTGGGTSVHDVNTESGDFVGRDKVINIFLQLSDQVLALQGQDSARHTAWQQVDWTKAEEAYRASLLRHYNKLRVFGKSQDDTLENVFIDVYLLEELTARRYFDIQQLRESGKAQHIFGGNDGKRHSGLSLVQEGRNLYVLGKPGAGKTTFLRWVTIQAARYHLNRLSIFVSLHEWATSEHKELLPFIVEQFAVCKFPDAALFVEQLLTEGRAIVLFDGLDEVKQELGQRLHLSNLLRNFTRQYDGCQFLITCRIAASDYYFPAFDDVEVADFTHEQVEQYAHKWFGIDETKLNAFLAELKQVENRGLRELCTSPLLLSMLCVDFDRTMHFPPNRAELYERALNVLLSEWDSRRSIQRDQIFYRELSPQRKKWLFATIAKPTFERGEYLFREEELAQGLVACLILLPGAPPPLDIDGVAVLKAIEAQHSILVERAQGVYSFAHLTFHEYFTARYIVDHRDDGEVSALVRNHLTDNRWREVFLLTSSLLPSTKSFFGEMCRQIDTLVAPDETLVALLTWADSRIASDMHHEQYDTSRVVYITLALAYTLNLNHNLGFDRLNMLDRAIDFMHAYSLDKTIDINLYYALGYDLGTDADFDLARYLAHKLTHVSDSYWNLDFSLFYLWQMASLFGFTSDEIRNEYIKDFTCYVNNIIGLAKMANTNRITNELPALVIPDIHAAKSAWTHFADYLLKIIHNHLNLDRNWQLTLEQEQKFSSYFQANELLVQCLKLSVVSDRQAILDSLLLPPTTVDSGP